MTIDENMRAPEVSRRNLFGGIALSMLMPQPLSAEQVAGTISALDPATLHNLLRGLIFLGMFGDPVIDDDAAALLGQIEQRLPGAALLMALYRSYHEQNILPFGRDENSANLATLHRAVAETHPVAFTYTNLQGEKTTRRVLPLALVHPPHGIQLLAWCELRGDFRKFFVSAIEALALNEAQFSDRRLELLQGLVESEGIAV